MKRVNKFCFRGTYNGRLWEKNYMSARQCFFYWSYVRVKFGLKICQCFFYWSKVLVMIGLKICQCSSIVPKFLENAETLSECWNHPFNHFFQHFCIINVSGVQSSCHDWFVDLSCLMIGL